jgi:hypothetical protein
MLFSLTSDGTERTRSFDLVAERALVGMAWKNAIYWVRSAKARAQVFESRTTVAVDGSRKSACIDA